MDVMSVVRPIINIACPVQFSEEALKADDKDAIDAAAAKLTEVTGSVAQKMYAAQSEEAASGGDQAEAAAGDDAVDAVDAEFEEVKDDKN